MSIINFAAYHGTDSKYYNKIFANGFKVKINDEHWLGNGVYFFIECELAKWWTRIKHSSFGHNVSNPIIIEVDIKCDTDCIADFRILEKYKWISERYCEFQKELLEIGGRTLTYNQLRCAFFDWLKDEYDVKVVIGGFHKQKDSYLDTTLPDEFHLPYIEYQVCVFDQSAINIKKTIKV